MIHVHPGNALIIESLIAWTLAVLGLLPVVLEVLVGLDQVVVVIASNGLGEHLHEGCLVLVLQADQAFFAENTFLVQAEHRWSLEIAVDWAISQNLLHHFFLGSGTPSSANEIGLLNLGNWLALLIVSTFVTLSFALVGSALFGDQVSVFGEEHIEVWPSSIAALVHIITGHEELWREHRWLLAVLKFETSFHHLGEGNRVAGAAMLLISVIRSKIIPVHISEVERFWKLGVWDVSSLFVLFHELLCGGQRFLEFLISVHAKFLFGWGSLFLLLIGVGDLGEGNRAFLLTVGTVTGVVLLVLAHVCLPAEVCLIDLLNENIHLIRWLMVEVEISPLTTGFFCLMVGFLVERLRLSAAKFHEVWGLSGNIFNFNIVMLHDLVILHLASVVSLRSLNIIMLLLNSLEALDFMLTHGVSFSRLLGDVLNESNHRLLAEGVEFVVVSGFDR